MNPSLTQAQPGYSGPDAVLVSITLMLASLGAVLSYSAAPWANGAVGIHLGWLVAGVAVLACFYRVSHSLWWKIGSVLYLVALLLCLGLAVLPLLGLPFSESAQNILAPAASGGIILGMLLVMAKQLSFLARNRAPSQSFRGLLRLALLALPAVALISYSASWIDGSLVLVAALFLLFLAGAKVVHLLLILAGWLTGVAAVQAGIMLWSEGGSAWELLSSFRTSLHFQSPVALMQGWFGRGLGEGLAKFSLEADRFVPLIVVAEELGAFALIVIGGLYAVFGLRGLWLANLCARREGEEYLALIIAGASFSLAFPALLGIGVCWGLPGGGALSVPFLSTTAGESLADMALVGLILRADSERHTLETWVR